MGFDNTVDNRWRPDFEGTRRRVREEEAEKRAVREDRAGDRIFFSRELAVVPSPQRRPIYDAHDPQTRALIAQHERLEQLPHGTLVADRLSKWNWIDAMQGPEDKQRFLEPLIESVRRDPVANEAALLFLLVAFEPVRRGVSKRFMLARGGLTPAVKDVSWTSRAEARMVREIDKQALYDVTRAAALEAIFRYPSPAPKKFFPWLRETIAHRTLDHLRGELAQIETTCHNAAEAEAVQAALAGFEDVEAPAMRHSAGLRAWRRHIELRAMYEVVDEFFDESAVRETCRAAVGRLPRRQSEVIDGLFFGGQTAADLAAARDVSRSTIYNTESQAKGKLHDDDCFFSALYRLGVVRDRARAQGLKERFPDGRLPDGRRIVHIDLAA